MTPVLKFDSPVVRLAIADDTAPPFEAVQEGWVVRETFRPRAYLFKGDKYGAYQISLEHQIEDGEDAGNAYIEGRFLAQDLDHMCIYATGRPLRQRNVDEFMSPVFPPQGWTSNGESVLEADDWALMTTSVSNASLYRREPTLPLKAILAALAAYRATDDLTLKIASLHFEAFTTESNEGPYLLLAQAVEVIRNLLVGKPLPSPVTTHFKRSSPEWLYKMSNYRSNTRHPATKRPQVDLHPRMDLQEEADFLHDADVLARYVVSDRLGVPFVIS